ncbi:MAG TPA: hypothetical protein PKL60_03490 [Anaerolineaceae bacterium]|nr:hypothetical protein [Anaerolineaceae bacterium]
MELRRSDHLPPRALLLSLLLLGVLFGSAACQPQYQGRPTAQPTRVPSRTPTPTITSTLPPAPTATPSPSPTLTHTPTPLPSTTPTETPTPIPPRAAVLFPLKAGGANTVNWSYFYLSRKELREDNSLLSLSATVAFQLLDRGIHSETVRVHDQDVTVYYLRVSHVFNQVPIETKLVLTGYFGRAVPVSALPADGAAFVNLRTQNSDAVFEPWRIQSDWLLPFEQRQALFQQMTLTDFEQLLADLPERVILLAHHPVIWPPDDYAQADLDMARVSAQAARLQAFFDHDAFDLLTGQSRMAEAWSAYLLHNQVIPTDVAQAGLSYSAEYLIIVIP